MNTQPSPILIKAVELTEDGKWHSYEDLIRELSKLVPPGKAMRRTERERSYLVSSDIRTKPITTERILTSGKRSIARDTLKAEYFETDPAKGSPHPDPKRMIRLAKIPPSVEYARRSDPKKLLPALLETEFPITQLSTLTRPQLIQLTLHMLYWMKCPLERR